MRASIDELADYAAALGFAVTYRQVRPNPYLALRREDIELQYFGIEAEPSTSRLAHALADAVVLGDSHGDVEQGAKIPRRRRPPVLGRRPAGRPGRGAAYLLELAVRRGDATGAREVLARIDALELSGADRAAAAGALASVAELLAVSEDLDADQRRP